MKIFFITNVLLYLIPSLCQDERVLHCSAKPGCQISALCDRAPRDWSKLGFNIDEYLKRNEFPITCVGKNAVQSKDYSSLLSLISGNDQDIRNLEKKVDDNTVKIKDITGSGGMSVQSREIRELREENQKKSTEITDLRKTNEKQSSEIKELEKKTVDQSREIKRLRNENNLKFSQVNQRINKLYSQLQSKHLEMDSSDAKEDSVTTDLRTWYRATNGHRYKLFLDEVNYSTAKANCKKYGALLASAGIRDEAVRREILPLVKAADANTWIGLNDLQKEGTFYWEDSVRASASSTPWGDGEPNSFQIKKEDCVEMRSAYNWKLNDIDCSQLKKYLCELYI